MMEFIYRQIQRSEAFAAAEIEKECLHTPWSEGQILDMPEYSCYLGAFQGETLCGIGSAYFPMGECQIINIAVLPQYRKRGIGKGLLEEIIRLSLEKECEYISLEVAEDNNSAISLYEKCGFAAIGKRKNFYGKVSALVMEKKL